MSDNQKYASLTQFLRKHKTIPEKPFTHTSIPGPGVFPGSYCIPDDKLDIFYDLYNKHVFKNNLKAHLTERHKDLVRYLLILILDTNQMIRPVDIVMNLLTILLRFIAKNIKDLIGTLLMMIIL